jgi:hypothetical protein
VEQISKEKDMALPEYPLMDVEDYLLLVRNSQNARYEYLDGELRMLAGGTTYHSRIAVNLASAIQEGLGDSTCCVFNSDIHLKLSESRYVQPDVTVSCDQRDQELDEAIQYPCLVVEVLSPSTESLDRGKKIFLLSRMPNHTRMYDGRLFKHIDRSLPPRRGWLGAMHIWAGEQSNISKYRCTVPHRYHLQRYEIERSQKQQTLM